MVGGALNPVVVDLVWGRQLERNYAEAIYWRCWYMRIFPFSLELQHPSLNPWGPFVVIPESHSAYHYKGALRAQPILEFKWSKSDSLSLEYKGTDSCPSLAQSTLRLRFGGSPGDRCGLLCNRPMAPKSAHLPSLATKTKPIKASY